MEGFLEGADYDGKLNSAQKYLDAPSHSIVKSTYEKIHHLK